MEGTKIILISKKQKQIKIKVERNDIEQVEKYKYLGTIMNNQRNMHDNDISQY